MRVGSCHRRRQQVLSLKLGLKIYQVTRQLVADNLDPGRFQRGVERIVVDDAAMREGKNAQAVV